MSDDKGKGADPPPAAKDDNQKMSDDKGKG
jgi:hypothetical protein